MGDQAKFKRFMVRDEKTAGIVSDGWDGLQSTSMNFVGNGRN